MPPDNLPQTDEFERELARHLRPVAPPGDFSSRVLARVALHPAPRRTRTVAPIRWAAGALAASLLLGTGLGLELQHRRREQQAADQQLALAAEITSHALAQTRQQLRQEGLTLPHDEPTQETHP